MIQGMSEWRQIMTEIDELGSALLEMVLFDWPASPYRTVEWLQAFVGLAYRAGASAIGCGWWMLTHFTALLASEELEGPSPGV